MWHQFAHEIFSTLFLPYSGKKPWSIRLTYELKTGEMTLPVICCLFGMCAYNCTKNKCSFNIFGPLQFQQQISLNAFHISLDGLTWDFKKDSVEKCEKNLKYYTKMIVFYPDCILSREVSIHILCHSDGRREKSLKRGETDVSGGRLDYVSFFHFLKIL